MNVREIDIFKVPNVTPVHKPVTKQQREENHCGFKQWIACNQECKYYNTCTRRKK